MINSNNFILLLCNEKYIESRIGSSTLHSFTINVISYLFLRYNKNSIEKKNCTIIIYFQYRRKCVLVNILPVSNLLGKDLFI